MISETDQQCLYIAFQAQGHFYDSLKTACPNTFVIDFGGKDNVKMLLYQTIYKKSFDSS